MKLSILFNAAVTTAVTVVVAAAFVLEVQPASHSVLVKGPDDPSLLRVAVDIVPAPPDTPTLLMRMTDVNAPNTTAVVLRYNREVELRLDKNVIGTVVYRFELVHAGNGSVMTATTVLYHVVWRADVHAAARRGSGAGAGAGAGAAEGWVRPQVPTSPHPPTPTPPPRPLRVLHVAGGSFDGQKQIMLSQWQSADPARVRFLFLWVCARAVPDPDDPVACPVDPTVQALLTRSPHVTMAKWSPVSTFVSDIDPDAVAEPEINDAGAGVGASAGNGSLSDYLAGAPVTVDGLVSYLIHRLRAAAPRPRPLDVMSPAWAASLWRQLSEPLRALLPIDVVVQGNNGELADVVVPEAARALGARAVLLDIAANLVAPHPLFAFDAVVSPSAYAASAFPYVGGKGPEKAVLRFVVPPGVDVRAFEGEMARRGGQPACPPQCPAPPNPHHHDHTDAPHGHGHGRGCGCFVVGFVARLVSPKAPGMFLAAARVVLDRWVPPSDGQRTPPHVVFLVVGAGPLRASLETLAHDLGIASHVHFAGTAAQPAVAASYAAMDVFVMPSLMPSETFGVVLIEAMAMGVPVVSFGLHGQAEALDAWVPAETGDNGTCAYGDTPAQDGSCRAPGDVTDGPHAHAVVVDDLSASALADAVLALLRNATWRGELGARARRAVETRFTSERNGRAMAEVYRAIVDAADADAASETPLRLSRGGE